MTSLRTLHEALFDADFSSDRPFITFKNHMTSYNQFRQDVLNVTTWLNQLGIGKGHCVAVLLPKCLEYTQSIFGVISAGAAYVPLDTSNPASRLDKILGNAQPSLIISTLRYSEHLKTRVPIFNIELTSDGKGLINKIEMDGSCPEPPNVSLDDLAAILFTSGSTGQPKGVQLTHRNVGAFVTWAIKTFRITEQDRLISMAPFHFDLSTLDLFATVSAKACVHLIDEASLNFPAVMCHAMHTQGTTICYAAPSIWRMMLSHGRLGQVNLSTLRLALFAGEVFPVAALRNLMNALPSPEYYNLYGPTETNVCTYYHLPVVPEETVTSIPIGRACEHLDVFILDELGNRLGAGQTGEICVRGSAVTPGYHNMVELSQSVRVDGHVDSYRTGDLGYFDESGLLYYKGRRDNQVKIRGNRIELSEIESVIGAYPAVAECMVKFEPRGENDCKLIAYVVRTAECEDEDIFIQCRKHLPAIAIPQEIVFMDSFPHTSTGKIDRQKLLGAA